MRRLYTGLGDDFMNMTLISWASKEKLNETSKKLITLYIKHHCQPASMGP